MIVLTHAYLVAPDRLDDHGRLFRRLREAAARLGEELELLQELSPDLAPPDSTSLKPVRFVQIARFKDRAHLQQLQAAERGDATLQALLSELIALLDLPSQRQRGTYVSGYYVTV